MKAKWLKAVVAGFALALLTLGVLALLFSAIYDAATVGTFFEKVFLPCQVALTIAWALAVKNRMK